MMIACWRDQIYIFKKNVTSLFFLKIKFLAILFIIENLESAWVLFGGNAVLDLAVTHECPKFANNQQKFLIWHLCSQVCIDISDFCVPSYP